MSPSFGELAKNSFCDFWHFPPDYHVRIAGYPNTQLKKQEAVKTRQIYAALCSIVNGAAFSVPSHGGTLVICAWAARRLYVANHKLKFIKHELSKRDVELRPFMHRDWMIPVAVAVTGAAIGFGVDFGLHNFVPIGHVSVGMGQDTSLSAVMFPTPSGATATSMVHGVLPDPSVVSNVTGFIPASHAQEATAVAHHLHTAAAEGAKGFAEQWQHLFSHGHAAVESVITGSGDQSLAGAVGFVGGAHAAQAVEHSLSMLMGSQSLQWMSDKLDFESLRPRISRQLTCRRLPWSTGVLCDRCESPIQSGKFYHCCDCGDEDEFNLCTLCYKQNPTCLAEDHSLQQMQIAVPGESYHPEKTADGMKVIAGPSSLSCSFCAKSIAQGWYYDCWNCRQDKRLKRWTICLDCYKNGCICGGDDTHRLYAFPRAIFATFNADTPYQRRTNPQTGRATCKDCGVTVEKGAYYHCNKCEKGEYDLCMACYQTGRHCRRNDHVLTKHYAWKYKRNINPSTKKTWKCSNPDCLDTNRKNDFYFSCLEKGCNARQFGLCAPCYFSDLCCPVREHDMFKCIFK